MTRPRLQIRFLIPLLCLALPTRARADEDELGSGQIIAVEARPYRMVHEFSASLGILPLDALYTGFSIGAAYTLHLSDIWAWEVVNFHYSANAKTNLDATLAERWSVAPTSNPELEYLLGSEAVFSPMFGKVSLFNSSILFAETYFALGGGLARFTDGFRPQVNAGPGLRVFIGQRVSTRLDLRSALVPDLPSGFEHVLHAALSIAFNFGSIRATEIDARQDEIDTSTGFEALDELYPQSGGANVPNAGNVPSDKSDERRITRDGRGNP